MIEDSFYFLINEMIWHSIKEEPKEEGFYLVAIFDSSGKFIEMEDDWVYFKEYYGHELGPNRASGSKMYSYPHISHGPTHWMSRREFEMMMEAVPRKDEKGNLII